MKVNEIRAILKDMKKDELAYLIVEMYKQIPKKMRENKEIDELIKNPDAFKQARKKSMQPGQKLNFASVEHEVKAFIENAYAQNYFAPNRIVPKKERSNWRFTAKRLVNQVTELSGEERYAGACASLMVELYALFSYASGHYVFASGEPFDTIKIDQPTFLKRVILMKKQVENPEQWIPEILNMITEDTTAWDITFEALAVTFVETLTNAPLKETAIKYADDMIRKRKSAGRSSTAPRFSNEKYAKERYINSLTLTVFIIQSTLDEYEKAVKYFNKHHIETIDKEIKLFVLLDLVKHYQRVEDWINVYEKAVKQSIQPRESLKRTYEHVIETNTFPESVFEFGLREWGE